MNWISSVWFLPLLSAPTLALSLYKQNAGLFFLAIFFALVWFAIHISKLRSLFTVLASLCLTFCLFEVPLYLIHKYNQAYEDPSDPVIGWVNHDEFKRLHSKMAKKNESQGDTWVLNKVTNLRHGDRHPEYDYLISTTQCSKYFVRGRCFDNPHSWHFGDSFTFGFGVKESDTFVSLAAKEVKAVNFGVSSFNPLQMFERANHLVAEDANPSRLPNSMWFHLFLGNDVGETLAYIDPQWKARVDPDRAFIKVHLLKRLRNVTTKLKIQLLGIDRSIHWVPGHIVSINKHFWNQYKSRFFAAISPEFRKLRGQYQGNIVVSLIPPKELCVEGQYWDTLVGEFRDYFKQYEGVDVTSYGSIAECPRFFANYFKLDTHFSPAGHKDYYDRIIKPRLSILPLWDGDRLSRYRRRRTLATTGPHGPQEIPGPGKRSE